MHLPFGVLLPEGAATSRDQGPPTLALERGSHAFLNGEIEESVQWRRLFKTLNREDEIECFSLGPFAEAPVRGQGRTNHVLTPGCKRIRDFVAAKHGDRFCAVLAHRHVSSERCADEFFDQLWIRLDRLIPNNEAARELDHIFCGELNEVAQARVFGKKIPR